MFCSAQIILKKISELVQCSHVLRTEGGGDEEKVPTCMNDLNFRDFAMVDVKCLQKAFPMYYRKGLFSAAELVVLLEYMLIAAPMEDGTYFLPSLLPDLPLEEIVNHRSTSHEPMIIYYPNMWWALCLL